MPPVLVKFGRSFNRLGRFRYSVAT